MSTIAAIGWPVIDRFRFGDVLAVSPHGLGIAIGFLIGASVLVRIGPRRIVPDDGSRADDELIERREEVRADLEKMIFWALVGTIIGARFFYVLAHYSEFSSPIEMLEVWKGGISLLGGIAGAILINLPRMRRAGYGFFRVMDPAVVCLALGIGIGRVGDLIIGDHLGRPTSWLLAWTYHGGRLAPPWVCVRGTCAATLQGGAIETISRSGATLREASGHLVAQGVGVHQTALYDMLLAWILFAVLWRLQGRERRLGVLTLTFGVWYGCMRLLEDSVRVDKRFGPLTGSQWTALVVVIVSATTLIVWAIRSRRGGRPADRAEPPREEDPSAVGS